MNRRTTLLLTGMTVLGSAIATLPHASFAQSDPLAGLWQVNLAKSKYSPGPAPKSSTVYLQGEGQNRKLTAVGIDAAGNPRVIANALFVDDGQSRPVTGTADYDAVSSTRVDAYTANVSRTKAGRVVQTGTRVLSQDGKTMTIRITGNDANGRQINYVAVYEKQ
jgi:hypothetical protein